MVPLEAGKIGLKLTINNVLLVGNAFVWYLLVFKTLGFLTDQTTLSPSTILVFGLNAVSIALLAFAGSFIVDKFKERVKFLEIWMVSGVFLSLLPLLLDRTSFSSVLAISVLFGAYFGIGMPVVMGYFSANTSTENRAKVGGITFLVIGLLFSILGVFIINDVVTAFLALAAIRLTGFLVFRVLKKGKERIESAKLTYRDMERAKHINVSSPFRL